MRKTNTIAAASILLTLTSSAAFCQVIYRLTKISGPVFPLKFADINESGQATGHAVKQQLRRAQLWNGRWMRDLGTLGGSSSVGKAINASGQVAGDAQTSNGNTHAFLWDRGIMRDLGTLGGTNSQVVAMNDAGQVAGNSPLAGNTAHRAFLWDGATMRDLGTLGGEHSLAIDINSSGQVTGLTDVSGWQHAFLFDGNSMTDLGTLGGSTSFSSAINDSAWVTGQSDIAGDTGTHAFLWDGTQMRDLGTLGGPFSRGVDINVAGQVAGTATTADVEDHAVIWDGISMQDLGTLGGGCCTYAEAINAGGQVTGSASLPGFVARAFLWDGKTIHDLNDLIDPADPLKSHVTAVVGLAINDAGYIVARTSDSRTPQTSPAYLLSPAAPNDLGARNVTIDAVSFVRLRWSDPFADESRFQIQRAPVLDQQCGEFTTIGSRSEKVTVYRDKGVAPNTEYCYQLRVIRSTVVLTLSNIARIKTKE
jgi:probable HAF family extracellular repeat protein